MASHDVPNVLPFMWPGISFLSYNGVDVIEVRHESRDEATADVSQVTPLSPFGKQWAESRNRLL